MVEASGRGYLLKLWQGDNPVFGASLEESDRVPAALIWRGPDGFPFPDPKIKTVVKNSSFEYQSLEYVVKEETPFEVEPPPTKRLKTDEQQLRDSFSERLGRGQGDLKMAMDAFRELVSRYISTEKDDPKSYRFPAEPLWDTWDKPEMKDQLKRKREEIRAKLKVYNPNDRQKVVIGVRLGSGFGKTHVLTEAPDLLSAAKGIYLTYNLDQDLRVDKESPVKCLLIRLMLALIGCKQYKCSLFLLENSGVVQDITEDALRNLFVFYASQQASERDIVIGVDELMLLGNLPAKQVVSELAKSAAQYWKETKSMCTVLVSSLATQVFETKSGRPVDDWVPSRPNPDTLVHFAKSLPENKREKAMALVNAVSGRHMRSIVIAFKCLGQKVDCSVQYLFNEMRGQLGNKLRLEELKLICQHVCQSIKSKEQGDWREIESLTDNSHAVPPVFLKLAYEDQDSQTKTCLDELLHSFSLFDSAGKHLENISKWYDLFRASLELPVVPANARVNINSGTRDCNSTRWYYDLNFNNLMSLSEEALLKQERVFEEGKSQIQIVATGVVPKHDCYYHPKISNHPWVDRAYVAIHESQTLCLVLVQDKVNDSDFPEACDKLNKAADELTNLSTELKHALLIVNVIGAGTNTRAQKRLTWPYILIRGQEEVRQFYSANFADMVWFARERHLLAQQAKGRVKTKANGCCNGRAIIIGERENAGTSEVYQS